MWRPLCLALETGGQDMNTIQETVTAVGGADEAVFQIRHLASLWGAVIMSLIMYRSMRTDLWGKRETMLISVGLILVALGLSKEFGFTFGSLSGTAKLASQVEQNVTELQAVVTTIDQTAGALEQTSRTIAIANPSNPLGSNAAWAAYVNALNNGKAAIASPPVAAAPQAVFPGIGPGSETEAAKPGEQIR